MTAAPKPLRFAGYAALFNIPDAANDTILRGAFAKTIAEKRMPVPLYWQHRPDQKIGFAHTIAEDERGLRVIGQLDNPNGLAAHLLTRHEVSGLSFGYRAREYERDGQGRTLSEIDLFEVSLVTHPLQHGARIHLVA